MRVVNLLLLNRVTSRTHRPYTFLKGLDEFFQNPLEYLALPMSDSTYVATSGLEPPSSALVDA